jgi:hypothetical protein
MSDAVRDLVKQKIAVRFEHLVLRRERRRERSGVKSSVVLILARVHLRGASQQR